MTEFDTSFLEKLYLPPAASHKGQNGKLLIIGGSRLFHAASLWSLKIAARIVDMVFYSSVPENNAIVQKAKEEFRDGIVVSRDQIDQYVKEADCVLIGPGMERIQNYEFRIQNSYRRCLEWVGLFQGEGGRKKKRTKNEELKTKPKSLWEINRLEDEGEQTYYLTSYLLGKYPGKRFVIDAGALQMLELEWLLSLKEIPILTPHQKEFQDLLRLQPELKVEEMAKKYNCTILLKGQEDIVCSSKECMKIKGGNAGMTKGGTGDVLAGLVAALYCKNDAFLSAVCASYINKRAGDSLFERVGYYFSASDLADEIPRVMNEKIVKS